MRYKAMLEKLKRRHKLMVKNSYLLMHLPLEMRRLFKTKPVRSISGVCPVAVMSRPWPCPHGKCIYCPSVEGAPESYTGKEPAAMRAKRNEYDPYKQVKNRIFQYEINGHIANKLDVIIMGGTFLAQPQAYKTWFVKRIYDACNGFDARNLEEAQIANENAKYRVVGLTIETRPDYAKQTHADEMLLYGATRVELGVQAISDEIYKLTHRGHTVSDVVEATRVLKDTGFKLCYHMMLGLPGSNPDRDYEMFFELFNNEDFRPDQLKIYPTIVVKGSKLYEMWRRNEYQPYDFETTKELVKKIKQIVPPYVRIMRIQRDIPTHVIEAGVKKTNLRQIVQQEMEAEGKHCNCIRCREAGIRARKGIVAKKPKIYVYEYEASRGVEFFISYEDKQNRVLLGILRLRLPYEPHRPELKNAYIVRELHVYGPQTPVGEKGETQHRGIGRLLMAKAEEIAEHKVAVISGVGVRNYYRKLGYEREGRYMVKYL